MEDKDRSGNRERAVEDRVVREVVEMRERGERREGSMRREHVHAGRGIKRRNWGSKWVKVKT